MEEKIDKEDIVLYTLKDIERIFGLGRTNAYELMRSDGFPSFKINSKVYVEKNSLIKWIKLHEGKKYNF